MKLLVRIQRLEARVRKTQKRFVLLWIDPEGGTIKAADTHPHLPDDGQYTRYLTPYQPGGGSHAAKTH
jgi:hypothetical protein